MRNITSLTLALVFAGFVGCSGPNETNAAASSDTASEKSAENKQAGKAPVQTRGVVEETKPDGYKNGNPNPSLVNAGEGESPEAAPAEEAKGWSKGDTIPSGMEGVPAIQILEVHKNGSGDACGLGKTATLKYKAMLANGKVLDPGTRPFSFKVGSGRAIKGWDVVVSKMRIGDSFTILLPMKLAYGPSKGDLKFDMELLAVK